MRVITIAQTKYVQCGRQDVLRYELVVRRERERERERDALGEINDIYIVD